MISFRIYQYQKALALLKSGADTQGEMRMGFVARVYAKIFIPSFRGMPESRFKFDSEGWVSLRSTYPKEIRIKT